MGPGFESPVAHHKTLSSENLKVLFFCAWQRADDSLKIRSKLNCQICDKVIFQKSRIIGCLWTFWNCRFLKRDVIVVRVEFANASQDLGTTADS